MSKLTKIQKSEIEYAARLLKDDLPRARMVCRAGPRRSLDKVPEVLCMVTHVARSGMSRSIRLWIVIQSQKHDKQAQLREITGLVAEVLRLRITHGGVTVGGCGMDMCFKVVSDLSTALYGDAYSLSHDTI